MPNDIPFKDLAVSFAERQVDKERDQCRHATGTEIFWTDAFRRFVLRFFQEHLHQCGKMTRVRKSGFIAVVDRQLIKNSQKKILIAFFSQISTDLCAKHHSISSNATSICRTCVMHPWSTIFFESALSNERL